LPWQLRKSQQVSKVDLDRSRSLNLDLDWSQLSRPPSLLILLLKITVKQKFYKFKFVSYLSFIMVSPANSSSFVLSLSSIETVFGMLTVWETSFKLCKFKEEIIGNKMNNRNKTLFGWRKCGFEKPIFKL